MADHRRSVRPPLGAYLIDFGADFTKVLLDLGRLGDETRAAEAQGETDPDTWRGYADRLKVVHDQMAQVYAQYKEPNFGEVQARAGDMAEATRARIERARISHG